VSKQDFLNQNPEKRTRCAVYTRVMGYHRPVSSFNVGKKGEHKERTYFVEPENKNREQKELVCL